MTKEVTMIVEPLINDYAWQRTKSEPDLLLALSETTHATMASPGMLTGRLEGRLLKLLAGIAGARHILEIGTFTGYSALSLAEALPDHGRLYTCEVDPVAAATAKSFFARSPHGHKIKLRLGPALDTIEALDGPFDLVFIDADKRNYLRYYEAVIEKVRIGGLILIDNTLWSGRVLEPSDEDAHTIDALNRFIEADPRVENVLLTVRDGLHLVVRRS